MKVIDKINSALAQDLVTFSFEYFPPRTEEGVENLYERMDHMVALQPLFCDITWGAGGSTADLTLDIAIKMQNMVKHIRSHYGDYFGITVAGYPEAHPDSITSEAGATEEAYHKDLVYLKEKVDAGADVIITQLFYDTDLFLKFYNDCRQIGITCPIVPGIMPINNYKGFKRMTGFCKTTIPADVAAALEPIKDDDKAVTAFGIHLGTEMCKKILAHGIKNLHVYTLNLEKSAIGILQNLGLIDVSKIRRTLPWRPPTNIRRAKEDVRPIFWANRPRSYISRTVSWDEFPRGKWGDAHSPAYGAYSDYQFLRRRSRNKKIKEEWVVPLKTVKDIQELFASYCVGKIKSHPWSELEGLQPETAKINEKLVEINSKGFLTINSQPAVNGEKSDSPTLGWGGPGGYVYQKAYVEFFCAPEKLEKFVEKAKGVPSLTYMAVNSKGETRSNIGPSDVNAVTWGVFPGKEVIQPTIVDPVSFMVWKDEAFQTWDIEWASLYQEENMSKEIIKEVKETYFLVSLVENDYVEGDYFAVFEEI